MNNSEWFKDRFNYASTFEVQLEFKTTTGQLDTVVPKSSERMNNFLCVPSLPIQKSFLNELIWLILTLNESK